MDNSDEAYRGDNAAVIASFSDARFRYVSMTEVGLMFARHQGVDAARGSLISFIDDDSFISENWMRGVNLAFQNPSVGLVTGPNIPEYEQTPPSWLEGFWLTNAYGRYLGFLSLLDFGDASRVIPAEFVWGCNYSIRREIFYQAKGSHPDYLPSPWKSYQGDGEVGLSIKAAALGYDTQYSPLCAIRHWIPAARLTENYFGERAFFIGLHMSFTAYRREHGLGPMQGVALKRQHRRASLLNRLHYLSSRIQSRWAQVHTDSQQTAPEAGNLKQFIQGRRQAGWHFHRQALKSNAALRSYVLRSDFMDENAGLPE